MTDPAKLESDFLQTERLPDGRRRLLRDLVVCVQGEAVTVPKDCVTDFSSIPWFGRMLVRWSRVDIAGVVHDRLYHTADLSRARADEIWRLVAISGEHRANLFQAYVGWFALRIGGWWVWNQLRREQAEAATSHETAT